jgi:hypothetical protein
MKLQVQLAGRDAVALKVKYLINAAREGLRAGVSEAGLMFETEAKTQVAVSTGRLRDAIHTEPVIDEPERQQVVVTPAVEADNPYGFDPPYARRIEYGFIGADSLGRIYHQAAQPYMRPAYDSRKDEASGAIKDGVRDALIDASNQAAGARNRRTR